jgi:cardiolipin synthase
MMETPAAIKNHRVVNHACRETIYLNGDDYFNALFLDIAQAKSQIDLETYIFKNDSLGGRVVQALVNAAERGVRVRVLVDGVGTPGWGTFFIRELRTSGIETRVFHPFFWRIWQWSHTAVKRPFLRKALYFMTHVNTRNHRKVCVIDQKIAYVGSANVDRCHLSVKEGGKDWRDTIVRLEGVEPILGTAFELAWEHATMHERLQHLLEPIDTNTIIRLNNTRHRRRKLYKNLMRTLFRCKQRVWITNAYFVPDNFMLRKLSKLANAGIDVRILLPQKSDIPLMTWASATFYQRLLKSGVRIFEYLPSMLHAKTLILDDWFLVGSSNLNHRSLLHDLEVDVTLHSATSKQIIEAQFLTDLEQSREITWDNWQKRGWFQRVVGRMVLYIKYWI